MKIGDIDLGNYPILLAPMEDVTDVTFRLLAREFGASMVYSEFVSSDALVRNVRSSIAKLRIDDRERPAVVQIYGKEPSVVAEAAQIAVAEAKPDILDINFGCPVKKVAGKGAGSGLLRDVPRMLAITRAVRDAVQIPVTVKTRLGWDLEHIIIEDLAEQLQDSGAMALTIHGRTRSQLYTGTADWSYIRSVKANPRITIPIIGNGDITDGETALLRFQETGVDAVMVGRATIGRPWIFEEINAVIHGRPKPLRDFTWYLSILKRHIEESILESGERGGILHIRRHLATTPLLKGIPDFREKRVAILRAETKEELFALLDSVPKPC